MSATKFKYLYLIFRFLKVKHIEKGINPPSVNQIYFSGKYLLKGFRIGIVAGMIALTVSEITYLNLSKPREICY